MFGRDISLLLDLVRAAACVGELIREKISRTELNDTDVWILLLLSDALEIHPKDPQPRSTTWIAARSGFARPRVTMSLKRVQELGLATRALKPVPEDGRARRYSLTTAGRHEAERLFEELVSLDREVRYQGRIAITAKSVDPQVVAKALESLSTHRRIPLVGLDRRRTANVGKR